MDKLHSIKEKLTKMAYEELEHNSNRLCTKEMGEVIDMIKDISETVYYCTIVEAMENGTDEQHAKAVHTAVHSNPVMPTHME